MNGCTNFKPGGKPHLNDRAQVPPELLVTPEAPSMPVETDLILFGQELVGFFDETKTIIEQLTDLIKECEK